VSAEPDFDELLRGCERQAVHLEMRDGYSTGALAFVAWQRDPSIDPLNWYGFWLDLVCPLVARGVAVQRARIVSEPISEYIRFEYEITTALNLAAGEEVRWLPRRQASDLALPGNDFWLFDGRVVMLNHFYGAGEPTDHEVSHDPDLIKLCAASFAAVWARAIPHNQYQPT
jgi:Family of unknown function (DUF6879)